MARRHRHLRMAHSADNTNSQNKNNTATTEMERVINNYIDNNNINSQTTTSATAAVNEANTAQIAQTTENTKATLESTTSVIRSPTLRARRYPSPRRFLVNTLTQQSQPQPQYEHHQDYQSNNNSSKCNSSRSNNINNEEDVVDAMFHTPLGPSSISASPNTTLIHNSRSDTFNDNNENIVSISNYGYNYPSGGGGNNIFANESTNVNDRHHNRPSYLFPSHSTDSVSSTSHTSNHSYQYQLQYHNNDNIIDNMNVDSSIADKSNTSGRGNVKYVLTSPVSTVPSSLGRHSQTTSAHTTSLSLPISPTGASPTSQTNLYSTGSGGMSIIYPRKGKVGPYYGEDALHPLSHNDEDNMGEVASQQNMELAEVQVEGYFAQSLGVLIPNDLPRSTLMYVLTASDGRDSMFKLIQYTLQLTICFLKTPELFSSEAQVLTEAWAERFYKNYNTIRHGRSLFKIGRGMLNLFTIQSVMERLWLKYEDKIFNRITGAPLQTPNAISPSVPLLQSSSSLSSSYEVEKRTRTHFSYSYRLFVKILLFILGKMLGLPINNFAQKWKQALLIGGTDSTLTSPVGMFPQRTTQHYLNEGYIVNDTNNNINNTVTPSSLSKNVNEVNKGNATLSTAPLLSTMPSNVYMHVAKVEQQPVEELTTTSTNTNNLLSTNYNTNSSSIDKSKQMSVLYFGNKTSHSPQYISLDSFTTHHTTSEAALENNKQQETNMFAEKESKAYTAVPLLAENTESIIGDTCTSNKHSFSSDRDANTLANSTTLGEDSMNAFAPPPPIISSTLPSHYNEVDMCVNMPTHSLLHNTNTEKKDNVGVMQNECNVQKTTAALQKGDPLQSTEPQPQTTLLQPLKDKKSKQSAKASKEIEESNTTAESSANTSRIKQTELVATSAGTSFDEPFYGTHAKETQFFSSLEDTPHNMFRTKAPSYSDETTQEKKCNDNNNKSKVSKELELTKAQVAEEEDEEEVKHMAYFAPLYSTEDKMANELGKGENHVVENNNNIIQNNVNTENKLDDHHNASIMSFASMSENSDAHANSSHQITELIPASQAEPIMWRKAMLNFKPMYMTLLGIRSWAACCRRFLRDLTLISTEQFFRFTFVERHRPYLAKRINYLWLIVASIDLFLNSVRLCNKGWYQYANARQDVLCRCGCKVAESAEDKILRQGNLMARLKSNLYFPPLNLDFGAPMPSVIAYFEAAEPITMLPACSNCGFLYYKPSELPAVYHGHVGNASITSYSQSSHALTSAPTKSPLELLADVQSAAQSNKINYTNLIVSPSSSTTNSSSFTTSSTSGANVNTNVKIGEKINQASLAKVNEKNVALAKIVDVKAKDKGVGNEMMLIPWILRRLSDFIWLVRHHPNLRATLLLELRYLAELYLAYKYCFGGYETAKSDAPLNRILHPSCAIAGMVNAAIVLLRVTESAPK